MAVDEILARLGPTDPPPTLTELGGEDAALAAVGHLNADLVPRLIEVVRHNWLSDGDHVRLALGLAQRLPDVAAPLAAASCMDALVAVAAVRQDRALTRTVMDSLLTLVGAHAEDAEHALVASYAIRAATDLALLDVGVSAHPVLAAVEAVEDVPVEMAPGLARAVGRLMEHFDDDFLVRVLEDRVLAHDDAASDALVELGLAALRRAFDAAEEDTARASLVRAAELLDRAAAHDEARPDARAFAAAARAVVAFADDPGAMSMALDQLEAARAELDRYATNDNAEYRGAGPLRSVAGWHVLAATLRNVHAHIVAPDALHLRPAVEALVDAYSGMRLAVLDDERLGLRAFISPAVERSVSASDVLSAGAAQYAEEEDSPVAARQLVGEVVRPKVPMSLRPARRRLPRRP